MIAMVDSRRMWAEADFNPLILAMMPNKSRRKTVPMIIIAGMNESR